MRKIVLLCAFFTCKAALSFGQADSLMEMLNSGNESKKDDVRATFKATRIIDGSSVENLGAGVLDFRISHRFGEVNQGLQNFFGLDNATTRIGLDYGITKWLMIGLGHSTLNKEDDGFLKLKLLQQKHGGTPVSLSYAGYVSVQTTPAPSLPSYDSAAKWYLSNRFFYTHQLLIARKINDRISLQLMPTAVHYNLVDSTKFSNNTFAVGVGGRVKVTRRIAVTGEYYYRITNKDMLYNGQPTYNYLGLGIDIETGGHVFQLMFTNAAGLTERAFIGQATERWERGEIHFGFNISRVFTIVKPKDFKGSGW